MHAFARWILRSRLLVVLIMAVLVVAGSMAWSRLPVDAFPDVSNVQVMILSKAPGLAAVDVEQRVSYPIEQEMRGLPKVTQVRSQSKSGLSQVVVVFEDDADTYWTRQVVFERLAEAREHLPPGVESELGPISTGLGEIFQYTLESDQLSPTELRTLQDWVVAPRLKPVPGVNEVNSFGGYVKQYQVLVHPERLVEYGLTLNDVTDKLERNNANAGGGVVVQGWEQTYLRGVGLIQDIPDIERIVLSSHNGSPVFVRDVADVVIGAQPRQGAVTRDGTGEVVAGMVIMLKGENSKEVVQRVNAEIERIRGSLPADVRLNVFYDRTSLIQACIRTVVNALGQGGLLVVLVLLLFLAEVRTALVVVLSLPLTYLATFIVMERLGLTANLMSVGGLAFSVGMVVDASIVVVENIRRRLAENRDPTGKREIVASAFVEILRPVAFSILIIAIILVPLYTLQGVEGKMFRPLATALFIALLASLAVAFTVVPVLSELILKQMPIRELRVVRWAHLGYLWLLERCVRHPARTVMTALAGLSMAAALVPRLGTEFMPPLDEGAIAINVVRLPNASLEGTTRVATYMEKRLLAFPEVTAVVSKSGRAEISEDPMGPEQTDVFIMLAPQSEWQSGRTKSELVEAIQAELSQIPGLRLSFSQPIALRVNELISGVKSDLAVKVFGDDLEQLKGYADRIASQLRDVPGAKDIKVEQVSGMRQFDLDIDREAAARYGLNVADLNDTIETGVAGEVATTMIEGQRRVNVVVRLPRNVRDGPQQIARLLVRSPSGERVPIGALAEIHTVEAPAAVSRENGMRRVVVEVNVRGRDLGGFVADAQSVLAPLESEFPAGYFLEYGGQFENQERAMHQLAVVVPIALVLIVVLLYLALRSLGSALLVLLNLPFALVGGVVAAVAFRMHLSVSAAVAFIVLLGIAVQNGVVLVAFFRQLRQEGRSVADTIREGCKLRFRPLLMTAFTTFIGYSPMLFANGSGADIQKPLAVVVMGGIVTSTLLTLLVLPAVYGWIAGRQEMKATAATMGAGHPRDWALEEATP